MTDPAPQSLDDYLESRFVPTDPPGFDADHPDEAHVDWWRGHHDRHGGSVSSLVAALPQFEIQIAEGASASDAYARLVRRMEPAAESVRPASIFADPQGVSWRIEDHPAGALPVVVLEAREDFERGYRALGARCEPVAIGRNVHALYVSGLPSPVRARAARSAFLASGNEPADWAAEMQRRRAVDATSFHDRLILLHPAPYAGLAPSEVGDEFDAVTWTAASMRLRLEHEFTHHATARLLGSFRLHVHDEVIADLMGFGGAIGRFEADLFLKGLGIRNREVTSDARLWTYVQTLDRSAVPALVEVLEAVAGNLERAAEGLFAEDGPDRLRIIREIAKYDLRTMAAPAWSISRKSGEARPGP